MILLAKILGVWLALAVAFSVAFVIVRALATRPRRRGDFRPILGGGE